MLFRSTASDRPQRPSARPRLQGEASEPSGACTACSHSESPHTHPHCTLHTQVMDDARLDARMKHAGVPRTIHSDHQRGRASKERHRSRRVRPEHALTPSNHTPILIAPSTASDRPQRPSARPRLQGEAHTRVMDDARLSARMKRVGVPRTVHSDQQRGRASKERHRSRRVRPEHALTRSHQTPTLIAPSTHR